MLTSNPPIMRRACILCWRKRAAISGNFPSGKVRLIPKKAPPCPTQPVTSDQPSGVICLWHISTNKRRKFTYKKNWYYVSFNKSFNAIMDSNNSVSSIDAVTDEGAHSGIHTASRSSDMHNSKSIATLRNRKEFSISLQILILMGFKYSKFNTDHLKSTVVQTVGKTLYLHPHRFLLKRLRKCAEGEKISV